MMHFTPTLLRWYKQYGRKQLPWCKNRTPYRVWVSEIMLQQTQVSTVLAYYHRFMQRFPSIKRLAEADEDTVLAHWSGLGYYRRARFLHRSAQIIMQQHQGRFPRQYQAICALPGIGRSTAGAILSLAMYTPAAILDGNVKRVLARYHGIKEAINTPTTEKKLWAIAEQHVPQSDCADYTQAIMDFGATVCTKQPHCNTCPMNDHCIAYQQNSVQQIPYKPRKVTVKTLPMHLLLIHQADATLLIQRPDQGIWAKLWCFPEYQGTNKQLSTWCQQTLGIIPKATHQGPSLKHLLTHRHLHITTTVVEIAPHGKALPKVPALWYKGVSINGGIPQVVDKLYRRLHDEVMA
jgi:A/G-specific adenine glycosylase